MSRALFPYLASAALEHRPGRRWGEGKAPLVAADQPSTRPAAGPSSPPLPCRLPLRTAKQVCARVAVSALASQGACWRLASATRPGCALHAPSWRRDRSRAGSRGGADRPSAGHQRCGHSVTLFLFTVSAAARCSARRRRAQGERGRQRDVGAASGEGGGGRRGLPSSVSAAAT